MTGQFFEDASKDQLRTSTAVTGTLFWGEACAGHRSFIILLEDTDTCSSLLTVPNKSYNAFLSFFTAVSLPWTGKALRRSTQLPQNLLKDLARMVKGLVKFSLSSAKEFHAAQAG